MSCINISQIHIFIQWCSHFRSLYQIYLELILLVDFSKFEIKQSHSLISLPLALSGQTDALRSWKQGI